MTGDIRHTRLALVTLLVAGAVAGPIGPVPAPRGPALERQEGIAFTAWWNDGYDGRAAEDAMANLADTGAEWVSVLSTWYQPTFRSVRIRPTESTPTDDGLVHAIRTAHALGLDVMVKPHVDLSDDPQHWRGQIGTAWRARSDRWDRWFRSYRRFMFHFAELAEREGVEQLSVGTELSGTVHRGRQWRRVIAGVRARFSGTLLYASTVGGEERRIRWWDALDLIGVDAYYALTDENDPTVAELESAWAPHVAALAELSAAWGDKPIVFTEIGYRSIDGANRAPWDWQASGEPDVEEQADCYAAAFASVWDEPWFAGMYWWDWRADPAIGGPNDDGYTPFGKPAESVIGLRY